MLASLEYYASCFYLACHFHVLSSAPWLRKKNYANVIFQITTYYEFTVAKCQTTTSAFRKVV